ncbi:hypothetical protein FSARC_11787 [Fusarium sarcochroum]|uniref:Uncharacterized protein n=1 Tax=Fusarium sarcochroum TaxID=1208366 RepID=A0A8H4WZS0_9HYPO|nr:hypothetical protein FSARC_11787 [Fusarium sarcochroum]
MASRRSQFVDAPEAPEYYLQEPGYFYQIPQTPLRTVRPSPVRVPEDHYSQMYASPAPTRYYIPCCRRPRRSSRHSRTYDSDGSTDSYLSYENAQAAQPGGDRLPPRIALKQLSDYLHDATVFYNTQLIEFAREHQRQGHDTTNEPLRQWLWSDWMSRRDNSTRENFTSTKTSVTLLLRQVESAVATPWLEDADLQARFEFTFKTLQAICGEVVRLAGRAMVDWQACRFLAVELKNARMYANPEGSIQRHLFRGWDNDDLW